MFIPIRQLNLDSFMSNQNVKYISRKRFILWSATFLSAIGLMKVLNSLRSKKQETTKFLTQEGQLVEVDKKHTESQGLKIYTSDLKNWIHK